MTLNLTPEEKLEHRRSQIRLAQQKFFLKTENKKKYRGREYRSRYSDKYDAMLYYKRTFNSFRRICID